MFIGKGNKYMDRYLYKLVVKIRTLFYDTEYEPYLKGCDIRIYETDEVGRFGDFDIMEIDFFWQRW